MEEQSAQWLIQRGLRVLHRNWTCPFGELDLVCQEQESWVFVEVKYRSHSSFGGALASFSYPKQCRMLRAIQCFLNTYQLDHQPCRVDALFWQGANNKAPLWIKDIELVADVQRQ